MKKLAFALTLLLNVMVFPQPNFQFQRINSELGLSANTVTRITQDSKGFLWIGTLEGLNRYDGYNFKIFKHNPDYSTSIGANSIYSIFEDKSGTLWIGTFDGGLNKFDSDKEVFIRYVNDEKDHNSISNNKVYAICEDGNNSLWVGTANGLNKFNKKTGKFTRYFQNDSDQNSLSSSIISSLIYDDKTNVLWIGTKSGGLTKFDLSQNKFFRYQPDEKNPFSVSENFINYLFKDASGVIWLGTFGGGLNKFDEKENKFIVYKKSGGHHYIPTDFVLSIGSDNSGNLLLGTYEDGLIILNPKTNKFVSYDHNVADPESIGDNLIQDIYKDKRGLIWLATWTSGVNKIITNKNFLHFKHNASNKNSLSGNGVTAICEDRDGIVWIGTELNGLNSFDMTSGNFTNYLHDPNNKYSIASDGVSDIKEDREGNLWIVTDGYGFCRFDKKNNRSISYQNNPLDSNSLPIDQVSVLIEDKYGDLLIGTFGAGLIKFDKKKNTFTKIKYNPDEPDDITAAGIYSLYDDSKGLIWIGTYSNGLFIYDRKSGKSKWYYNIPGDFESLSDNIVSSILTSKDGSVWIGTSNGLNKFDPIKGKFKRITEFDGLPNNTIYGILEDDQGGLWISTNKGLSRYNPTTGTFRNYNKRDGLQDDEFNQWACFKGKSGNLYFGGINGFNVFNPALIKESDFKPPLVFTNFLLFNKPVSIGYDSHLNRTILNSSLNEMTEINLTHEDYVFSLEFAALDYIIPHNIKYAYKLEGFDKEWTYVNSNRRFATYTNLSQRAYTFKVKSTNSDGVWNEPGRSLAIIIHPPWWKTGWAFSAYGLILIFIIYLIRAYDLKRQRLKHQLDLEHEHAEKLEEVDRIKSRFFANISHEFRTPLTLILGPAEQILSNHAGDVAKKNAGLIKKNANNMLNLINQLLDLSRLDSGRLELKAANQNLIPFLKGMVMSFESIAIMKSIKFNLNVTEDELIVCFDREKMETIIKNLLSNAFKFTPIGKEISVSLLKENENSITLKVRDTGIGISKEQLPKIFDRFYQVNSAHTREHGGTGIGLALVKELVELHHGSISVDSKLGEWTEFKIILPIGKEHFIEQEVVENDNQLPIEKLTIDKTEFIHSTNHNSNLENLRTNKNIVLIVEDNRDVRDFIKDSLGDEYHFEEAENGEEGITKAEEFIPDLIISDVMMPKMDGNEMTRRLKSDHKTSHIPIIMLTAKSGQEYRIEGLETGADDFLTKPFDAKELHIRIKNLISLRKKLQEIYCSNTITSLAKSKHKLKGIDIQFMDRILKVVDEHISEEEFTIEDFGHEVGMSRSQMFRKIKALTGKSCSVYLRSVRLARAKNMLQNHEANISEIAYSVGFGSPSYFARCFKEEFGYAPSELVK
jgi:signal transduction histidine kinase/ligand-binding sensor domain-containing protein/DNA-binding response OmpR family regulator